MVHILYLESKKGVKKMKKLLLMGVLCTLIILAVPMKINAAEMGVGLTYDVNYQKTGYHLEEYDKIQCKHSQQSSCYVSEETSGMITNEDILRRSFRNTGNIPGELWFQYKTVNAPGVENVSHIQALFSIPENTLGNPEYLNQDVIKEAGGRTSVRIAEPYKCAMDGHAGYSYFRAYFSYCSRTCKYYYTGDEHVWYGCTAGEIGANMTAFHPYTHILTRYKIVPNHYTVIYHGNGDTDNKEDISTSCTYDEEFHIISNQYSKDGYLFCGWNTEPNGSGKGYSENQNALNLTNENNKEIHLYAQWKPISYYIAFNGNGNTSGCMDTLKCKFDSMCNIGENKYVKQWNVTYDPSGGVSDTENDVANAEMCGWYDWNSIIYKGKEYKSKEFSAPFYANRHKKNYNKYELLKTWLNQKENTKDTDKDSLYPVNSNLSNMVLTNGKTVFLTAAWRPGSVILPNATKESYSFVGWYDENDKFIGKAGDTYIPQHDIKLTAKWSKPEVEILPTKENISFNCNGITYFKDPVKLQLIAKDNYFKIINSYMSDGNEENYEESTQNPFIRSYTKECCDKDDKIEVKGYCCDENGTRSNLAQYIFYMDYTAPTPQNYMIVDGKNDNTKEIRVAASDNQSGLSKFILQKQEESGSWTNCIVHDITNEKEYESAERTFTVTEYQNFYRIAYVDHLGNTSYSDAFYVVPLTIQATISKLDGESAGNNDVLKYMQYGNMQAVINVNLTGYPDKVTYEFDNSLQAFGFQKIEHNIICNENGTTTDSISFIIPDNIEFDRQYNIKITGYRNKDNAEKKQIVSFMVTAYDSQKIHSRIRSQSGMAVHD